MFQASLLEWLLIFLSVVILFVFFIKNKNSKLLNKKFIFFAVSLLSLLIFLKIFDDVRTQGAITNVDYLISKQITSIWSPFLNKIFLFITRLFNFAAVMILIFLAFFFAKIKKIERAALVIIGFIIAFFSETLIKILTKIARPSDSLIQVFGYGFPSGHATIAAAILSLIIFCFFDLIKNKTQRVLFIAANIILILFIGFTRIYLNVHKFSDVVAGFTLGVFIASVLILIEKKVS